MSFLIINQQKKIKIPKSYILKILPLIYKNLSQKKILLTKQKKLDLTLVFTSAKQIQGLNKNFRNKNKPTDILSFNSLDPSLLGELILCPEIIVEQALMNNWPQKYEYLYMLIHGVLHLLGYDHELDEDSDRMLKLQDRVFNQISDGPKVS